MRHVTLKKLNIGKTIGKHILFTTKLYSPEYYHCAVLPYPAVQNKTGRSGSEKKVAGKKFLIQYTREMDRYVTSLSTAGL